MSLDDVHAEALHDYYADPPEDDRPTPDEYAEPHTRPHRPLRRDGWDLIGQPSDIDNPDRPF